MAMKRGNLQQMTRDAEVFNGSGRDEPVETPQRATAAQMAGRKIKQPRSRTGGGAATAGGGMGMNAGFAGPGVQTAVGTPSFQPPQSSGGFNFSAPTPVNGSEVQFGSMNTNGQNANPPNGGYTGTMFSVPSGFGKVPSTDAFGGSSTAQNTNASTLFNAPSSFNFGGGSTNNNPFSASNQQPTTGFGSSSTSNLFASASSKPADTTLFGMSSASQTPSLFGSSIPPPTQNLFGQQTSSSQTPSLFAPQTSTEQSQNEESSHSNSMMTDDSPTRPVQNNGSSLFNSAQQATAADPFAQTKSVPPLNLFGTPTQSTTSNIFAATASGNDKQPKNNASSSNIFGSAEQKAASNLFSFSSAASTSVSTASTGAKTNMFGDLKQSSSSTLFGNRKTGSSSVDAGTPSFSTNNTAKSGPSAGSLFSNGQLFGSAKDTGASRSEAGSSQAQDSHVVSTPSTTSSAKAPEKKEVEGSSKPDSANLFGNPAQPTASSGAQRTVDSSRGGSATNIATASMATLNSPAPTATAEKPYQSISDLVSPPAPGNLNEEERALWPDVWRCKVLEQLFKRHMKALGPDGTRGGDPNFLWIMLEFTKLTASLKQRFAGRVQAGSSSGGFTRASNAATLFPVQALTPAPATTGGSLFGKSSVSAAKPTAGSNLFASTGAGSSLFQTAAKSANNLPETTTQAAEPSSLFVSDASNKKRKPEEPLEKATKDGSLDLTKKSRTDEVSYPALPNAPELPESTVKAPATSEPPKFQMPTFGAGSGAASFLSQFGDKADKAQKDAAKRRKDEDYDSEEEDLETWQKRDKQQQEAKKAEYEAIAKKSSLGFVFKPTGDAGTTSSSSSSSSPFAVKDASAADKAAQQQADSSSTKSLFAKSAPANAATPTPLFGSSTTGTASGTVTQQKPLFSFEPKAPTDQPSTSLFASAKPSSSSSLFASAGSSGTPLFASSSSVLPTAKQLPSNFTFSASTSAAPAPAASSSIFGSSFTPSANAIGKPLGSSLFGSTTSLSQSTGPTGGLFDRVSSGQETAGLKDSVTQDNTFKGDASTPIKFSKSLPPSLAPPSLAPPSVTSETSRATTPATGDDTDANVGADDDAPKDEQLDLTQAVVGEEDEDVLIELRAKGSEMVKNKDGKADWVVRGVGQLKLLQNKESKKTRVLLRSSPAAKIVLNTQLLPSAKYVTSGAKGNTVRLPVVTGDGKLQQYIIMVKETKDADKLASLMEENKQR